MNRNENLEQIKRMFVNNGEYQFDDEKTSAKFIREVLREAEDKYSSEGYYHKYEDFKEFLYTHHVDSIAYWIYEDEYVN